MAAGGKVEGETPEVELSPLLTYAGEGLDFVQGQVYKGPLYLEKRPPAA